MKFIVTGFFILLVAMACAELWARWWQRRNKARLDEAQRIITKHEDELRRKRWRHYMRRFNGHGH